PAPALPDAVILLAVRRAIAAPRRVVAQQLGEGVGHSRHHRAHAARGRSRPWPPTGRRATDASRCAFPAFLSGRGLFPLLCAQTPPGGKRHGGAQARCAYSSLSTVISPAIMATQPPPISTRDTA